MIAELLMDKLELEIPDIFIRAYADDTCLVVKDFWRDGPELARFFKEFEAISGLRLNMNKSIVIPLQHMELQAFEARKQREVPAWAAMPTKSSCKYLGFHIGPGKGTSSWTEPVRKYLSRVDAWRDMPLGLYWDARVYNTLCMPVLAYVAQLEAPPQWVLAEVRNSLPKAAKGPGAWAVAEDLWALKEAYGFPCSFTRLDIYAKAAQARVFVSDSACKPHRRMVRSYKIMANALKDSENIQNLVNWREWYHNSFTFQLMRNREGIEAIAGGIEVIRLARKKQGSNGAPDHAWEKQCQRSVYMCLHSLTLEPPWQRVRQKLERWLLQNASKHLGIPGAARQNYRHTC